MNNELAELRMVSSRLAILVGGIENLAATWQADAVVDLADFARVYCRQFLETYDTVLQEAGEPTGQEVAEALESIEVRL